MTASQSTPAASPGASPSPRPAARADVRRHALPYVLIRLTGLLLAVLVCGHFVIMHFANDVAATNASFIAKRWSQWLWVVWDWLMLAAGLLHGALGMSTALRDYSSGRRRAILRALLTGLTAALFVFGSIVIIAGTTA
jgi:succinate dehydrogenase / fumarate reductase, membrane anchor subunit